MLERVIVNIKANKEKNTRLNILNTSWGGKNEFLRKFNHLQEGSVREAMEFFHEKKGKVNTKNIKNRVRLCMCGRICQADRGIN